jgi:hypothetical protein
MQLQNILGRGAAAQPRTASRQSTVKVWSVASSERLVVQSNGASGSGDAPITAADVRNYAKRAFGKNPDTLTTRDIYLGAAFAVREKLHDAFDNTQAYWK